MTDELKPVLDKPMRRKTPKAKGQRLAKIIRFATGASGITSFLMSAFYFFGFAENDQLAIHLLSAFALCFGIGALVYLPTFFIARKAHIFLRQGPRPRQSRQIFAVILPWPVLAFFLAQLGGYWAALAAAIYALTLLCAYWAFDMAKSDK